MFTLTGNRLLDVVIVFVVVYGLSELVQYFIRKRVVKDVSMPLGGDLVEVSKDNSDK